MDKEIFLKDLPYGVKLLNPDWDGPITRVFFKFPVSRQAMNNKNFDLEGHLKQRFKNALRAFRIRKRIEELHLTHRLHVDTQERDPEMVDICFHIEYARI